MHRKPAAAIATTPYLRLAATMAPNVALFKDAAQLCAVSINWMILSSLAIEKHT